ncbi:MAG: arylesterase [Spirochaetaceae bacterium]|nr:arylesterase [Spirochaetaceae bacterium]|tara:strand:+ start:103326 stop:103982 length:657 start_codon:yes stop_codon:yes gene_type:complete
MCRGLGVRTVTLALLALIAGCSIKDYFMQPTILFLGDSFTEGYGLLPDQSFPAIIQRKLENQERSWKVVNGGISGDTVMDAYYRLGPLLKKHAPVDYLVVFLGANDLFNQTDPEFSYNHFGKIIEDARRSNPAIQIFVARMPALPGMDPDRARRFEAIFDRLESEFQVELLPFFLEGVMLNSELCLPDGVHPNARGMALVAETVWEALFVERLLSSGG